jgi:uroporphyrinogen decarboxylase
MNHWDRMRAAMKGEPVDRPPVCLWRHWPPEDHEADSLAEVIIRWQKEYDCDLVKHAPAGSYPVEDWGGQTAYEPSQDLEVGVRTFLRRPVTDAAKWPELEQLDVTRGHLGEQLRAVRLVAEALAGTVPIMQTVFSPLNVAQKLAGPRAWDDMRSEPRLFKQGLQILAETTARFAVESLRAGAHGFFFSLPCDARLFSEAEYREFGEPFERIILDAVRPDAFIIMVSVMAQEPMIDLLAGYPLDALSWTDRATGPSLSEAGRRFGGLRMAGLDVQRLFHGPSAAIAAEVHDAVAQTGSRRLLVGTGGAPWIRTPPEHFRAARQAVEELAA